MEHFSFLQEITIVFILSSFVIFLFNKMKLPSILGFIISGLLAGPYGFKLISEVEQVNLISEIGIILLLFTIGLEFSLKKLNKIKDIFFYGGSLQVFGTIILTFAAAYFILGFPVKLSLVISFIISLSSTAIVLKIFQEQGETQTPHGNISVGILIFQDITVVIMLLLIPYMSAGAQADFAGIIYALLKSALIILGFFLVARKIVPKLIYEVLKLQNNELFLIFSLSICFIIAFIANKAGLSLAFGAFLAGIIISESEYSHHVFENIMPFKEVFVSFFFISIGMLLNINFFLQRPFVIILLALLIMFFKCIIVILGMRIIKIPLKAAFLAGISLSQIGEFSFLLTRFAYENGILSDAIFQYLISSTIITMMLSILLIKEMHAVVGWLDRFVSFDALEKGERKSDSSLKNHVIIIGYGISGKNLVKSCKTFNIPYVIIEFNPKTVRYYSIKEENIFFGDASQEHVLKEANIEEAKLVSLAISDPVATRRTVYKIREIAPSIDIIARTRFYQEVNGLRSLGADYVVAEEYEASIRIFNIVLNKYLVSGDDIDKFEKLLRKNSYQAFGDYSETDTFHDLLNNIPEYEIQTLSLKNLPSFVGKTFEDLQLIRRFDILVLAVKKGDELIANPLADRVLESGDQLVVFGRSDGIKKLFGEQKKK